MSKFETLIMRITLVVILGGFVLSMAYLVLPMTMWLWGPYVCITLKQETIRNLAGFDFEISRTINCDPAINVLVSKAGQTKKTLIFRFHPPDSETIPRIASTEAGAVRISMEYVPYICCRTERWETLTIQYAINYLDDPRPPPDRC